MKAVTPLHTHRTHISAYRDEEPVDWLPVNLLPPLQLVPTWINNQ
jgi:hypothetical protein